MSVPITNAYVAPGAKYNDSKVVSWLRSPLHTEQTFQKYHGETIPDNYVEGFQRNLHKISVEIYKSSLFVDGKRRFTMSTAIFRIMLFIQIPEKIIMIKQIIIRPCAAKYGFFRIILYHIAKLCILYSCDLWVESPFDDTSKIMDRSFGEDVINDSRIDPFSQCDDDYKIIENDKLKSGNLAFRLGLVKEVGIEREGDLIIQSKDTMGMDPHIECVKGKFPSAHYLNYGF